MNNGCKKRWSNGWMNERNESKKEGILEGMNEQTDIQMNNGCMDDGWKDNLMADWLKGWLAG